ncbi:hypothetical protein GCM10008986_33440 [Salinibacillus aidingensis]|uniref:Uncharacterized protein n=1 Tax=Salinibacillus aidingensis TaxID=237684 RepID=A0ABN1BQA0_9BACI
MVPEYLYFLTFGSFVAFTVYLPNFLVSHFGLTEVDAGMRENFYKDMWEDIRENGFWQGEIWNKRKNGEIYREWLTISTIKDETGKENYYAGMFTEIPKNQ